MASPESARKSPNEEQTSKSSDPVESHPEPLEESSECSEKVSGGDVKIRREITTKTKRVSFHFGTNSSESQDVVLSTIQNIYDSKTTIEDNDANLVRNNSTRGNSSVDKLKGRYEDIAKQTDNNLKANTVVRAKANTDNSSTNNTKNPGNIDEHVGGEPPGEENTHKSKSESLKAEFINSQPQTSGSSNCTSGTPNSSENPLLRTTSNIEKLQSNLSTRLSIDTIEKLRSKYSPASFGYPRDTKLPKKVQFSEDQHSRIPVPTPRVSLKTPHNEELKKQEVFKKSEDEQIVEFKKEEDKQKEELKQEVDKPTEELKKQEDKNIKELKKEENKQNEEFKKPKGKEIVAFKKEEGKQKEEFKKEEDKPTAEFEKPEDKHTEELKKEKNKQGEEFKQPKGKEIIAFKKEEDKQKEEFRKEEDKPTAELKKPEHKHTEELKKGENKQGEEFKKPKGREIIAFKKEEDKQKEEFKKKEDKPTAELKKPEHKHTEELKKEENKQSEKFKKPKHKQTVEIKKQEDKHSGDFKQEEDKSNLVIAKDCKVVLDSSSEREEIKTITVKLVSVPDNSDQAKTEPTAEEPKDENSNLVLTEKPLGITKPKPKLKPPAIPSKPKQLTTKQVKAPKIPGEYRSPEKGEIEQITGIELQVTYDNIKFAEPEDKHFIVRRSSSEDSIDKVESFFSDFVMEKKPKEKKRSNSFRKILSGSFFGRDRKKSDDEKTKPKKKDNAVFADNAQNESQAFDRNSSHRHTTDNAFPRREVQMKNTFHQNSSGSGPLYYYSPQTQVRKNSETNMGNRYTEMKGNNFASNSHHKYSTEEYVPMDNGNLNKFEGSQRTYMNVNKYIDTSSSSSNTLESENRSSTYQNALIAQAEMRQIRENENLQRSSQRSAIPVNPNRRNSPGYHENRFFKHSDSPEMFRESPPRPPDSSQNLQLVKPKALIPINSERPLPNPYHNNQDKAGGNYENFENTKTLDRNLNVDNSKPFPQKNSVYGRTVAPSDKSTNRSVVVEDVYGTVFDSISPRSPTQSNLEYLRNRRPQSPPERRLDSGNRAPQSSPQTDFLRTQRLMSPKPRNLETESPKNLSTRSEEYSDLESTQEQVRTSFDHVRPQKPQTPIQRNLTYSESQSPRSLVSKDQQHYHGQALQSLAQTNTERLRAQKPESPIQRIIEYSRTQSPDNPIPRNFEYSSPTASQRLTETDSDYLRARSPLSLEYLRTRSLSPQHSQRSGSTCSSPTSKSPRSLEATKLKLPSNREKVELQPRIRSPIPQAKISTDKIIATELLRAKRSPTPVHDNLPPKHISSNRPASYQGTSNVDDNLSSPANRRVISPGAHSTPQGVDESASNEYIYLNSPVLRNKPSPSPKEASVAECLQAAEWQRQQRELDKSPALESPQQITTDAVVHVNPEEERYVVRNKYSSLPPNLHQRSSVNPPQLYSRQAQLPSPRSLNSSYNNVRAQTPVQAPPSPNSKSPEKQHMLHNVEAFYWRELRKLKDKEEQDLLRYRQQQLYVYGYVEDPVFTRRSRSVSPGVQRGRRSLSLPRDVRPVPTGRGQLPAPESIPEGRPMIAKKPIVLSLDSTYGQVRQPLQRNPNFIRNTFERSTIGPIGMNKNSKLMYENYQPSEGARAVKQQGGYNPIFKRGSLTTNAPAPDSQLQGSKKVSFTSTQNSGNPTSWPTKNGFTKSPPTRRIERDSMEDDVFLPTSPRAPQYRKVDEIYVRNVAEVDSKQQIYQNMGRGAMYVPHQPGGDFVERRVQEGFRENVEPPYGKTGQKQVTVPHQPRGDFVERRVQEGFRENVEPPYGRTGQKQVTVTNKVCDIYGRIHESSQKAPNSSVPQNYGQIKQVGYVYGQIQPTSNKNSPVVLRQSYNHLSSPQGNFVRGTRLTASVNDMYKRYPVESPRYELDPRYQTSANYSAEAPYRPLPPVPERRDSRAISSRKAVRGYVPISDNESGSEAGEVQRILQSGTRQKNFGVIGK